MKMFFLIKFWMGVKKLRPVIKSLRLTCVVTESVGTSFVVHGEVRRQFTITKWWLCCNTTHHLSVKIVKLFSCYSHFARFLFRLSDENIHVSFLRLEAVLRWISGNICNAISWLFLKIFQGDQGNIWIWIFEGKFLF